MVVSLVAVTISRSIAQLVRHEEVLITHQRERRVRGVEELKPHEAEITEKLLPSFIRCTSTEEQISHLAVQLLLSMF